MSAVYGIISYILIIAMLLGYVLVKRWGDKEEKNYDQFRDENQANQNDTIRTWSLKIIVDYSKAVYGVMLGKLTLLMVQV